MYEKSRSSLDISRLLSSLVHVQLKMPFGFAGDTAGRRVVAATVSE
jgi:hypothetical protein